MKPKKILLKVDFLYFLCKNKGLRYIFKKYILERFFNFLRFSPSYLVLRGIELIIPKHYSRRHTLPSYLQLEVTSKCNMKCRNCTRDTLSESGDLRLENFFHIIKQFPFLGEVKLQGLGEPLLNSSLIDMASFLKKKGTRTYIATNATIITKELASNLVRYFDKIEISLDSPNRKTLTNIRGRDCMSKVMNGIELLNSLNKKSDIAINFVMEKENINEINDLIILANKLRLDHINIISLQNWVLPGASHEDKRGDLLHREIKSNTEIKSKLNKLKSYARSLDIYLDFSIPEQKEQSCFWYKNGVYISWNGYVTPCCIRPNYEEFNFGNVFEKNIKEIWNSPTYINFRSDLKIGNTPSLCQGCYYG